MRVLLYTLLGLLVALAQARGQNFGNIPSGVIIGNPGPGTAPARPLSNLPGVFTNTQMNTTVEVLLNGISPAVEYPGLFAGNFATEAITGGINVANSSTVFQADAIAAYVNNSSTVTNPVGLFALVKSKATNTKNWGLNTVCSDGGFAIQWCVNEIDINVENASTLVNGFGILGASTVAPTNGAGVVIGPLNSSPLYKWPQGFSTADGAAVNGLSLGKTTNVAGANIGGQGIVLAYSNGSGTSMAYVIDVDTTGQVALETSAGQGLSKFYVDGILTINGTTTNLPTINYSQAGTTKYQSFVDASGSWALRDNTNALPAMSIISSGTLTLGETGKTVNLNGTNIQANGNNGVTSATCTQWTNGLCTHN
jgi:hypothetical protein